MVPRDHSWSLLTAIDHVPEADVSEAAEARRSFIPFTGEDRAYLHDLNRMSMGEPFDDAAHLALVFDGDEQEGWS